ncbi:Uncharacterized protein OS=Sorangium cellulosum (strain So ce56) GN=sce5710 PE=4 SV=1 [Gemmata massiliana]|uniref:SMI1/KNR4 family protein n=1 Tax=Gemmata massiliana TaxID=1210884 RepID=A0A6P2CW08_9BACT|nr:hypothetical protein [Gemmata massiliana]VTR93161.1 Uncharacterized protein OS=Sorangium cellulosum (strain So ce56) GN=sce5710 PE=4 SV=1 [Gemmata massiliana]
MTEAEWLTCAEPAPMLEFLRGRASDRKLRLFVCGCVRQTHLNAEQTNRVLRVAEDIADGLAVDKERNELLEALYDPEEGIDAIHIDLLIRSPNTRWVDERVADEARVVGFQTVPFQSLNHRRTEWQKIVQSEHARQTTTLRDTFGNPFRPITFSPEWRTGTAVSLAQQMYESRDFGTMPILADALQDAGCDSADVLDHCRGEGPHVRGCWVVDLVLGKA